MNYGKIENDTQAGRVFRYLKDNIGKWFSSLELTLLLSQPAISTRISEIRAQLATNEDLDVESERRENGKWYYRLVELMPTC